MRSTLFNIATCQTLHVRAPAARWVWALCALLFAMPAPAALTALPADDLGNIHAQGLFWSDKITGSELAGSNAYSTPFTFYRVGIDGDLALNANLGKLQLGCGGVNDFVNPRACDIDIDYVSLMGRNANNVGNPLSAFTLRRPYLEFAVKNDGTANREIVGFRIGAENTDGAISAGRRYAAGQTNQENLIVGESIAAADDPVPASNCTSAVEGNGTAMCHSGINSVSGSLGLELGLSMYVTASVTLLNIETWACAGRTTMTLDDCGTARSDAVFADLAGTRMQTLALRSVKLRGNFLIVDEAYAQLVTELRFIHQLTFNDSGDFFISFQREPVAYPRNSKMTPIAEMTANGTINTAFDSCAITAFAPARCNSAYSVPANTGWWLNAPNVKLLDIIQPNADLGSRSISEALVLLGPPGLEITNVELNMTPTKNCYGATRFC